EILETDALAPSDFDLAVEAGTGLRLKHRDGCQTERAHAIDSGALRRRVEATLDHLAALVARAVLPGARGRRRDCARHQMLRPAVEAVRSRRVTSRLKVSGSCTFSIAAS